MLADIKPPTTIMIAEDHPLMCKAIRVTLQSEKEFSIIGEVRDGVSAVEQANKLKPNIIVMDIDLPKLNGIIATQKIKAQNPQIIILVLTVYDDIEHVTAALEAGAAGYLTKNILDKDLVNALKLISSGDAQMVSPAFLNKVITHISESKSRVISHSEQLTTRDLQILRLASQGYVNRDIAEELGLSIFTIKRYMNDIFSKLGVASRTEAVIKAIQNGLISLNEKRS